MKKALIYSIIGLFLVSCGGDETETQPVDTGEAYFPMKEGLYREYKIVDERYQRGSIDTSIYYLREELKEVVEVSDEQQQWVRRYKRPDLSSEWLFDSTWVQAKNELNAFYVENGVRFNKLEFPLFSDKQWDFNAFNAKDELTYQVRFINGQFNEFTPAIYISDVDSIESLVSREYEYEVYLKEVGLAEKHKENLNFQPGLDTVGSRIHQQLIHYGSN